LKRSVDTRRFVYPVVFGSLWGIWEISVGSYLHALNVPIKGAIMTFVGVIIALTGRYFVKRKGVLLTIGGIASFIKIFSIGGFVLSPFFAILIEALILEILVDIMKDNAISYSLAGGITLLWPPIHRILFQGLIFGSGIYYWYYSLLKRASSLLGIGVDKAFLLILLYALFLFLAGMISGLAAWTLSNSLSRRMG